VRQDTCPPRTSFRGWWSFDESWVTPARRQPCIWMAMGVRAALAGSGKTGLGEGRRGPGLKNGMEGRNKLAAVLGMPCKGRSQVGEAAGAALRAARPCQATLLLRARRRLTPLLKQIATTESKTRQSSIVLGNTSQRTRKFAIDSPGLRLSNFA